MPNDAQTSARIAVYGASGYTGRLIAAELHRRGAEFVLAGRNAAKLEIVAEDIGGAETRAVSLDDPAALRSLLEPCSAVIACAGPFELHGEPVLAAAMDSKTHYIDTTGEQAFMRKVFDVYGPQATESGVAAVTAMGFDYVPGDMIAALTAEGMGTLDDLVLAYHTKGFGATRGTALSAVGSMAGGDMEWRGGALEPASQSISRGTFEFPAPIGRQRMVRYPAGEHITVPRHVDTRGVRTMLNASMFTLHPRLAATAPLTLPFVQLAARTPARRVIEAGIGRLPEGPSEPKRRASRFCIVCEATEGGERRRGTITGRDVYGLTARATVVAAIECSAPGYDRSGALAPSEAFDPAKFLAGLADFGVDYEVVPA